MQNPLIRNSYLPPGHHQHPVENALAEDLTAVLAITERHDGPVAAAVMQAWWRSHREWFVVGRGDDGAVTAYSVVVPLSEVDRRLAGDDPVLAAFLTDLAHRPLQGNQEVLLHRRALGARRGEQAAPELGAMVIDIKRLYLELRPRLARVLAVVSDWTAVGPVLRAMGFGRVQPQIQLGEARFQACALDFGPGSVDGWLLRHILVEAEPVAPSGRTVEETAGAISGGAERAPIARLSAREREVLTVLAEGLTNVELAERLFISERTANRHLSNIFTKLGVRNRTAAARLAIEAGLAG